MPIITGEIRNERPTLKIIIAPDSFKGTLSAADAAGAIAAGIRQILPDAILQLMPLADGGEGTLDAILSATQGARCTVLVTGALGEPVSAAYGLLDDANGPIAMLEAAQVVGLAQAANSNVMQRSTRGLGELIRHCLEQNVRRFMIGLGGSSTNDGGAGLLAALGGEMAGSIRQRDCADTPRISAAASR